jgi:hypothetical protein
VDLNIILLDDETRPNARHQFVFADYFAISRRKHTQNFERSAADLNARALVRQLAPIEIDPEWAKAEFVVGHRFRLCSQRIQNN